MKSWTDSELIKAYIEGSDAAFKLLYERHQPLLYKKAYGKLKDINSAEEFCQDTWIKVIDNLKANKYKDEEGKFKNWLFVVGYNLFISSKRPVIKSIKSLSLDAALDNGVTYHEIISDNYSNIEDTIIKNEAEIDIEKLISTIKSPLQQEIVTLRFMGLSFSDIAYKKNRDNYNGLTASFKRGFEYMQIKVKEYPFKFLKNKPLLNIEKLK